MTFFGEIALVVVIAVVAGFIAHLLRQPVIIGFISAGFLIGLFKHSELAGVGFIENLASIGVALLLFLIGLEMDFRELKRVTLPAFLVGLGQIVFTFGIGFFIAGYLGFAMVPALYIAIALTFSSTIVIVKLLSEKKDLNSLYGRVVIGILLVQDFVAIFVLLFVSGIHSGEGVISLLGVTFLKGLGLVIATIALSRIFPKILNLVARSQEMLYLFGIAWALGISAFAAAIGLTIEIGGFLGGLALASSSEQFQISSRLKPLRDFFLILFFVILGIQAFEGGTPVALVPVIVLSAFVLIGNPIIVIFVMGVLGYRSRTSFLSGISVAQISEFSLIIVALGHRLGDLSSADVSLVTLIAVITIFVSSYYISYGDKLYKFFRPIGKYFEFRKRLVEELPPETQLKNHIVLVGVHRMGSGILEALINSGADFVAIDFDPVVVKKLTGMGVPVVYGDIEDSDVQERVGIRNANVVISTVPGFKDNLAIVKLLEGHDRSIVTIVTADDGWYAKELYKEGADYVLVPHFIGGQEIAEIIGRSGGLSRLKKLRRRDQKAFENL